MAFPNPRKTWVTGEVVTAATLNAEVRDALDETAVAKVTTAGDLTYATAARVLARLGIGTAGQVLVVNGGATAPQWSGTLGGDITIGDDLTVTDLLLADRLGLGGTAPRLTDLLFGSKTYDPPTIAPFDNVSTTVTVTGATAGDFFLASHTQLQDSSQVKLSADYDSAGVVLAKFLSIRSSGDVVIGSGTLAVLGFRAVAS
jgi:hypothetical protein